MAEAQTQVAATPAPTTPFEYRHARQVEASSIAQEIQAEIAKSGGGFVDIAQDASSSSKTKEDTETADDGASETTTQDADSTTADTSSVSSTSVALPEAAKAAIESNDLPAFVEALGISDEQAAALFKIDGATYRANRLERQALRKRAKEVKAAETSGLEKIVQKEQLLTKKFGDPENLRKRWESGDISSFFEAMESWAGVSSKVVQKAWYKWIAEGKTTDLSDQAKLARYEKADRDRQEKTADPANDPVEIKKAHDWISAGIKGDKLEKYPGVIQMCFDIMRKDYHAGVNTPKKALDVVRKRLKEEAKLKAQFGLVKLAQEEETPAKKVNPTVMQKSPPRRDSLRSTTAQSRRMNDREIALQVTSELGLRQF